MLKNLVPTEHHPSLHRMDSAQFPLAPVEYVPHPHSLPDSKYQLQDAIQHSLEESENEYCYGGYHPVRIGERFGEHKNYAVIRKLGWGHFSTVWLAYDFLTSKHVALKIVKSNERYAEAARDEIRILEKVKTKNPHHSGYKYLVQLLDSFIHIGPNGEHIVMVFELLGESLLGLLNTFQSVSKYYTIQNFSRAFNGLPLPVVKKIAKQIGYAMDYLHRECGLIHTDIKPENILIEVKDAEHFLEFLKYEANEPLDHFHQKPAIKCSKPLSFPLTPILSNSSTYSTMKTQKKSHSPTRTSSVSYCVYNTESSITGDHFDPANSINVNESEAFSDDDYDSEDDDTFDSSDDYFHNFDFYKTSTNTTCPPSLSTSRRSTMDGTIHEQLDDEQLASLVNIKIADLGNACYASHHFTNDIQTRQYRAPEILLGHSWGCSADCWSVACLLFELITGDYLFDPKTGPSYTKTDDHIAQILELLNPSKTELIQFNINSRYSTQYFEKDLVNMRRINKYKYWGLKEVLMQKYRLNDSTAQEIDELISPLLELDPSKRMDFGTWAHQHWLSDVKLTDEDESIKGLGNVSKDKIKGWAALASKD